MGQPSEIRYDIPGVLTAFGDDIAPLLAGLPSGPVELCAVAQGLVVLPDLAAGFGIPDDRIAEQDIRSADDLLRRLTDLDPTPIGGERPYDRRVVGTCRHFALLSCAFLRHRGFAARARCGFATYFVPDAFVDHWVVEYRHTDRQRWVRVDAEILGFDFVASPDDLAEGEFLSGGEAWTRCRSGNVDASSFGVHGVPHAWGIAEVRGNAIRDLAALSKVETLPWDAWGRMQASYDGETGDDYDELIDAVAATCASDDPAAISALAATEELRVPPTLVA